jgi:hypothetical protein
MSNYKLIQITNSQLPAAAANTFLPLGLITRRLNVNTNPCSVFQLASSTSDTLIISEPGYYKITYSGTFSAGAEGLVSVSLVDNQQTLYTVSEDATAAEDVVNLTLCYVIKVANNCCNAATNCPANIQFQLGDVALGITPAPSTSNLIVEKIG